MGDSHFVGDEAAWLRQHAVVLFDMDANERMTGLNEPDPESDAPRVFVARGRRSMLIRFRADVPADIVSRLGMLAQELPPWDGRRPEPGAFEPLRQAVREWTGVVEESHGPAFRFGVAKRPTTPGDVVLIEETRGHLLDTHFPYTRSVLDWRSPVVGVVRDGAVVSACYSARRRPTACEAGVDTVEAYRGAGLAVAVVAAWAEAVEAAGMRPLYSTSWNNAASLRVASKLDLVAYADTLSFE
jgi:hypothetical protein